MNKGIKKAVLNWRLSLPNDQTINIQNILNAPFLGNDNLQSIIFFNLIQRYSITEKRKRITVSPSENKNKND